MRALAHLLPYYRRYLWPFWGGIAGLAIARVFEAGIPFFLKHGIDALAEGRDEIAAPALAILGCVLGRFLSIILSRRIIRRLGIYVAYDLRKRLYANLQSMGPAFFARHKTGDLMARAINDISLVRQLVGGGTRTVLVLAFSALVGLCFMLYESPSLTLMILPPMPIIAFVAYYLAKRIYGQSMEVQTGFSDLTAQVQENLNGIRTIQALGQEEAEIARFGAVNDEYADRNYRLIRTNSVLSAWMPALGALCSLAIIGIGGSAVLRGELSIGSFTAFFWYLTMVLWPVREAGNMVNLIQRGAAACTRLFDVLETRPEIDDPAHGEAGETSGDIEVEGLEYRYPGAREPALRDVSLRIGAGETVAVIGRVGSGKSTLIRLLVRLLDPPPGSVRIGGRDITEWPLAQLRDQVAVVPQDPFLFATSLGENIAYGDPEMAEAPIVDAAECADLSSMLEGLPQGLDTIVGERGITLSGGQKQRSTLARGLIRDAPVLLLDDCFSSVDTETEDHILRRLRGRRAGKTTLMVSHRVSTVRHADRIFVLDGGRLVESGTHEELLAAGGFYASLEQAQSRRGALLEQLEGDGPEVPA